MYIKLDKSKISILIFISIILTLGCLDDKTEIDDENLDLSLDSSDNSNVTHQPTATDISIETCLNSRVSYHEGWSGDAPESWIKDVLWATGQAPVTGTYRDIYVTLPEGKYLYDPETQALIPDTNKNSEPAAFVLTFDRESDFDAGVAYMFATLTSISLWDSTGSQLASCPIQESLYFGIRDVRGLTTELVAISSDGSLPDPTTSGERPLSDIMTDLQYTDDFSQKKISQTDLSQILWAGYGCTPHTTYNRRAGLTTPSWKAEYFLTENIYVVNQDGVYRYHNRDTSGDMSTRDHRLEQIQTSDIRDELKSTIALPDAPCYIVLCLDEDDVDKWYARLETGFVAGNILLQGSAIDMGCWYTTDISNPGKTDIKTVTGITDEDYPHAIVSIGYLQDE